MDRYVIKLSKEPSETSSNILSDNNSDHEPEASTSTLLADEHNYYEIEIPEDNDSNTSSEPLEGQIVNKRKRKIYTLNPQSSGDEFTFLDRSKTFPFCKICQKKLSGGRYHMIRHFNNDTHKKNERAVKSTAQIDKIFPNPEKEIKLQMIKQLELKFCCYICEHNLSLSLMNTFPDFCKSVYVDSEIAKEIKLKRKKTTQLIVGHLGPNFKSEIVKDLRKIHFSIIIDETTDVSTKKCLVLVVRYWKYESVCDRFLDLIETESGTAEGIFNALKQILDDNNIPYNNIIGFASDNVNVMMGSLKGVQSRVKRELQPNVFVQGCSCHSLHLCSSAAAKKLPGTVEQFARDVYSYFAYSSKRTAALTEFQVFANEKHHKMLHPSQTRWLSLQAVVDRILEHWNSFAAIFSE